LSPVQRRELKTARRLDILDRIIKEGKDSGYVGRSAADGHQCCPFIPGGDLGMSVSRAAFHSLHDVNPFGESVTGQLCPD